MRVSTTFIEAVPRCATPQQFALWKEAARMCRPSPRVGFCEDCTKEYQERMVAENRCENPHVWFCVDEDGFEQGTLKQKGEDNDDV